MSEQIEKDFKEAEEAYSKALEKESMAYHEMQLAIGAYDRARYRAVQKLKAFNNVLKARREGTP